VVLVVAACYFYLGHLKISWFIDWELLLWTSNTTLVCVATPLYLSVCIYCVYRRAASVQMDSAIHWWQWTSWERLSLITRLSGLTLYRRQAQHSSTSTTFSMSSNPSATTSLASRSTGVSYECHFHVSSLVVVWFRYETSTKFELSTVNKLHCIQLL